MRALLTLLLVACSGSPLDQDGHATARLLNDGCTDVTIVEHRYEPTGCGIPSYYFVGDAQCPHVGHVLREYCCDAAGHCTRVGDTRVP